MFPYNSAVGYNFCITEAIPFLSLLAGIPQVPNKYELTSTENVQDAKERQKLVLDAMVEYKYLNQTQADEIYAESIWQ